MSDPSEEPDDESASAPTPSPSMAESDLPEKDHETGWGLWASVPVYLVGVAAATFAVWLLRKELVVLFAAVFFGIALYKTAQWVSKKTGLSHGMAAVISYGLGLMFLTGFFVFSGQQLTDQYGELGRRVPSALETVGDRLSGVPVIGSAGEQIMEAGSDMARPDDVEEQPDEGEAEGGSESSGTPPMHLVQVTMAELGNVALIMLLAFYVGYDGKRYYDGLVRLIPDRRREPFVDLLDSVGQALPWWLVGRLASMTVVALLTAPGLYLLGVPLALVLALIAGVFSFVPLLGPLAAAIPAVLVTVESAPSQLVWVLVLYGGVQLLESWIITPRIQDGLAEIPPLILLSAQLCLGTLVGLWGIMFSTPLALAVLVSVQVLWMRHSLGRTVDTPGRQSA